MLKLYKEVVIIDEDKLPKSEAIHRLVKEKDAKLLIQFIFLVYDRSEDNPLRDFPLQERIARAKKVTFDDDIFSIEKAYPDEIKLISRAIKEYEEERIDKIQRDIDLYDKKMYQFITLLKSNKPEIVKNTHEITGRVTFSTNIDIITTVLDNSINIILDKAALVMMQKTGKFSNELRGRLSPNVKGKLRKK